MKIPGWWEFLLLALAAWRTFHLLAYDDILDRPRRYVTGLPQNWTEGARIPAGYREELADFLECPFCLGFWVALAWWGAWEITEDTLIVAVPFALSAGVVAAQKYLTSE